MRQVSFEMKRSDLAFMAGRKKELFLKFGRIAICVVLLKHKNDHVLDTCKEQRFALNEDIKRKLLLS